MGAQAFHGKRDSCRFDTRKVMEVNTALQSILPNSAVLHHRTEYIISIKLKNFCTIIYLLL